MSSTAVWPSGTNVAPRGSPDSQHQHVLLSYQDLQTLTQTLSTVGPQTQTWSLAAALVQMTTWPQVTVLATRIDMGPAVVQPSDINMVPSRGQEFCYPCRLQWHHGPLDIDTNPIHGRTMNPNMVLSISPGPNVTMPPDASTAIRCYNGPREWHRPQATGIACFWGARLGLGPGLKTANEVGGVRGRMGLGQKNLGSGAVYLTDG